MAKLKGILWGVVFVYLLYAMAIEGPLPELVGLFLAALCVAGLQRWQRSSAYRKAKEKHRRHTMR